MEFLHTINCIWCNTTITNCIPDSVSIKSLVCLGQLHDSSVAVGVPLASTIQWEEEGCEDRYSRSSEPYCPVSQSQWTQPLVKCLLLWSRESVTWFIFVLLKILCCSLWQITASVQGSQPYVSAVGTLCHIINDFYIVVDHQLVPCKAKSSISASDKLFVAWYWCHEGY